MLITLIYHWLAGFVCGSSFTADGWLVDCFIIPFQRVKHAPELECGWQAHSAAVVSVELVTHQQGTFIVSSSSDHTAKLFTLQGLCVGTFGQVSELERSVTLDPSVSCSCSVTNE